MIRKKSHHHFRKSSFQYDSMLHKHYLFLFCDKEKNYVLLFCRFLLCKFIYATLYMLSSVGCFFGLLFVLIFSLYLPLINKSYIWLSFSYATKFNRILLSRFLMFIKFINFISLKVGSLLIKSLHCIKCIKINLNFTNLKIN